MVRKIVETLQDDLTGEEATQSVTFGLDGIEYSIDLTDENARAFRELLAPYVACGARVRVKARNSKPVHGRTPREDLQAIRDWGRLHGYEVPARGRIPGVIVEAYRVANP